MRRQLATLFAGLLLPVASVAAAAETKVTVENTHLCCGGCVKGAEKAVKSVKGASVATDADAGTVTITAADAETAQKAVDALYAAGYTGKTTGATPKAADAVKAGKVKSATVSGVHNCCKKCTTALNKAIAKVPGATGAFDAKAETATITGDFDAKALSDALAAAGFAAKVEAK